MELDTLNAVLSKYRFPKDVKAIFRKSRINTLFPPQTYAIEKGALDGKNMLLSVPTAAGKTLIAELCMLKAILKKGGRCLYIVPLKALASEKYEDFKTKYAPLGIKVGIATGDLDTPERFLSRFQIVIATAEKIDSLIRSRTKWLINGLSVIVLDEIHFINDGTRGPTLEILTARMKQLNKDAQILALSATVSNAREMAQWLKANLVASEWRPIPLKEGVYFNESIRFKDEPKRIIKEDPADDLGKLCLDTLRGDGQVLTFVNSRRSAQAASRLLCRTVAPTLTDEERHQLKRLSKEMVGSPSSATKICRTLGEVVRHGVAFHHAGLRPKQRKLIEDNFRNNLIKVICSTPTLAAGVNLPARRAIIRDCKRFESGMGSAYIPTSEYKQCAGRAGRPQYDEFGEAVLIAKSNSESKVLFDRYINADPEPIVSKLGNESALRTHVLASIAGGYVHDINDTFDFLSHTFLAHQKQTKNLIEMISQIFDFLLDEGFINKSGFRFFATPFGQCTSRLYIDPISSLIIREGLNKIGTGHAFSSVGLLHMICCCPDSPLIKYGKNEVEEIELFDAKFQDEFIIGEEECPHLDDFMLNLCILKTTMLLSRWIEEDREEKICDEMGIGPGDIYRHTDSARWLLYAGSVFAELFEYKKMMFVLDRLKNRVQYGISEELVELAQLKGVGRVRARHLYNKGFRKIADLKYADLEHLATVTQIGRNLAQEILDQVTGKTRKRAVQTLREEVLERL